MKKALDLLIHLDDHKHDNLGRLFLDPADERETRRALRAYLGTKVAIKTIELDGTRLRVRVELPDFQAESDNLVRLARDLSSRARPQAARGQLEEALKLFPLNGGALKGLGRAAYGQADYARAAACFVRANEVLGEDGEALRALATISLRDGREASAVSYFERAVAINPRDQVSRQALAQLRERVAARFRPAGAPGPAAGRLVSPGQGPRTPGVRPRR